MSKHSTFNAGRALAQSGRPLPNLSRLPYATRQSFLGGYASGKK